MSETAILARVRVALSAAGAKVFRNQCGALYNKEGRLVTFGLGTGSSDLIGYHSVLVTDDMVGKRVAIFLAVEVKSPDGRATEAQRHFLETVEMAGGIAMLVRAPEDAVSGLSARNTGSGVAR